MTAVTLPPEVATECAERLSLIVTKLHRDAATLTRTISSLLTRKQHGRSLGTLKKYAGEHGQYGADEIREVIITIEAAMDPGHVKHLARSQARRDKAHAEFEKGRSEPWHSPIPIWDAPAPLQKPAKPRRNGNVIAGPWDGGGEARP